MRFGWNREAQIPEGARLVDAQGTDAAVYLYERNGVPCAVGFHGRAQKPDFRYRYTSEAARDASVSKFIQGRRARMEERKKARQHEPHRLQVGHVLVAIWGYDQTNVDWYEVTRTIGPHTIEVRKIATRSTATGWCQAREYPDIGNYIGEPMIKRPRGKFIVRIDDVRLARVWDARPVNTTSYA